MTVFMVLIVCVTIVGVAMICASVVLRIKESEGRERECPMLMEVRTIHNELERDSDRLDRVCERLELMTKEGEDGREEK